MTRSNSGLGLAAFVASLVLTACGPGQLTIIAALGDETSEDANALDDVEVRLLPYDRDEVFDSLTAAAPIPEPQIPEDLLAAQAEIAQAQQDWLDTETRWNDLRGTLQELNAELEGLNPGENRYRAIFNEWQDLEREYQQAERTVGSRFATFESLQAAAIGRMDSMRIVQADWGDQAFEDVTMVIMAKIELAGLDPLADTTNAQGVAGFETPPGQYWVYARHELPYEELYWNVPIVITREEPLVLRLTRENAEARPIF